MDDNVIPMVPESNHLENATNIQRMKAAVLIMEEVTTSVVASTAILDKKLFALDEQLQSISGALSHCNDVYTASLQKLSKCQTHRGNNIT